ncbi:hypothetical protein BASA81_003754 [Batrachochytrium salamandrivorans]|nr:hypothetical protein BASA81_003754 [Batrachochytrium salamandrivorans]
MDNASPPPGVGGEGGRGPGPPDGRPSPGSSHRVVKLNLARVLRDLTKLKVLCDMVKGGHHIVVHAFQFIKLFLLDEYETQPRSKSTAKNALNARLYPHYERVAYRKMRWYRYINSQRSDANMVNDFGAKLGTKEQVVLAYGDWLPPHEAPRSDEASGHAAAVREGGVPRSACRRVLDVAHVLRVRRAVRQVQNGAPTAPLDARDETSSPETRPAAMQQMQHALEQRQERVAQYHEVRNGGEERPRQAALHGQDQNR